MKSTPYDQTDISATYSTAQLKTDSTYTTREINFTPTTTRGVLYAMQRHEKVLMDYVGFRFAYVDSPLSTTIIYNQKNKCVLMYEL
ncbi:hypothetical protein, partial [Pseudoalteromonas sp. 0303]|uniref:hypothetical protein n=1 Tax=Pseudoalteromonas sp. 0303 TaxID=2743618 RepID=UPI001C659AF8